MSTTSAGRRVRVTASDVARAAGVSQSAVSRALGGGSVAPHVRARVIEAAKALGYRPNAMARAIAARRSGVVGVLMALDTNRQYPEALTELTRALTERGQRTMLFAVDRMRDLDATIDQLWSYQVDGVIALLGLADAQVRALEEHGVPVVLVNRPPGRYRVSSVSCDHRDCGDMLARRVLAAGHRVVGLIGGPLASALAVERIDGARAALREAGATIVEADGDFSYARGRAAAAGLLAADPRPTAIIAASDMSAIGAIDAAYLDAGLSVPGDVAVLGIDGSAAGRLGAYDLTTVRQPIGAIVQAAVEMLLARLADPAAPPERRLLAGTLLAGATG